MNLTVNDEQVEVEDGISVSALLERLDFPVRGIAVAVNSAVLPRSQWNSELPAGAQVEVVTAVQGG